MCCGTVKDPDTGLEYTEPGMNPDCVSGKPISEKQLPFLGSMVLNRGSRDERVGAQLTHSDEARCHCSIGAGPRRWAQPAGC